MERSSGTYHARWILGIVVFLIAGACNNRSPAVSGDVDAEFLTKANEVCAVGVASQGSRPPFPLKDFDPEAPDAEDLPIVAAYFDEWGDGEQIAKKLSDLGEPLTGKSTWQKLITLAENIGASSRTQINAAQAKDVAAFKLTLEEGAELREEIGAVGSSAGFSTNSECAKYYR